MSDKTREYEIFYFTSIALNPEEIANIKQQVIDAVAKCGGVIIATEDMGKKKLSYAIKQTRHGYFMHIAFKAEPSAVSSIKKAIGLIAEVLRFRLDIKKKVDIMTERPEEQAETKPKAKTKVKAADALITAPKPEKVNLKELDLKIDELLSDTNI